MNIVARPAWPDECMEMRAAGGRRGLRLALEREMIRIVVYVVLIVPWALIAGGLK